jgi:hypothetical protein
MIFTRGTWYLIWPDVDRESIYYQELLVIQICELDHTSYTSKICVFELAVSWEHVTARITVEYRTMFGDEHIPVHLLYLCNNADASCSLNCQLEIHGNWITKVHTSNNFVLINLMESSFSLTEVGLTYILILKLNYVMGNVAETKVWSSSQLKIIWMNTAC